MKRILVIGCPGSGKSTFSKKLHEITGIPLYHLDMIWHNPDKSHISEEEFDDKLAAILPRNEWIIDGTYMRTLNLRLQYCDTVFFLDYPMKVCLAGAEERLGQATTSNPFNEYEKELDDHFRQYILDFKEKKRPRIYESLEPWNRSHPGMYIFTSRQSADNFLNSLEDRSGI